MTTIEEALQRASFRLNKAGLTQARIEAEILLAGLMKTDRLQIILNRAGKLSPEMNTLYQEALEKRCALEPAAYILGEKKFFGYRFSINKSVLIPRPETELLIERALQWSVLQKPKVLTKIRCIDIGTGSGALAVTLALNIKGIEVWAVDISSEALELARHNAAEHRVLDKVKLVKGSYLSALRCFKPRPLFNLVVSNPPYLSHHDLDILPRGIKDYEPLEALNGGVDGLDGYRAILNELPGFVQKPALVLLEIGAGQKDAVEEICLKTGLFSTIIFNHDLAGHPRVLEGEIL